MPKPFRQACSFLKHNEEIASYLAAIERNARLLREIRSALPPPLPQHCLHASLDGGVLTLVTDSPVWASRLRFFAPELKRLRARRHAPIEACRIRVQPSFSETLSGPGANQRRRLSEQTAQHLRDTSACIADPDLAAALRRLAEAGAKGR